MNIQYRAWNRKLLNKILSALRKPCVSTCTMFLSTKTASLTERVAKSAKQNQPNCDSELAQLRFFHFKGHCTLSPKMSHAFFRILHPFLSKCMQRMWKRRKSNLIRIFFDGRKFRRQCANVIDSTWGRIYFLMCENFTRKFRTQWAETLTRGPNNKK